MSTTIFVRTPGPAAAGGRATAPFSGLRNPLRGRSTAQWYPVAVVGFNLDPPDDGLGVAPAQLVAGPGQNEGTEAECKDDFTKCRVFHTCLLVLGVGTRAPSTIAERR